MSYNEYNDLYVKAQKNKNAPYVCFSLDLVGSRKLSSKKLVEQIELMLKTMKEIIDCIELLEKKNNTKILLSDKNVKINKKIIGRPDGYYGNPCLNFGDFYAFYFYNNTINEKDFIKMFVHFAKENKLNYEYHFQSAKFETTDYVLGNKLYFLGYCTEYLQHNKGKTIISPFNQMNNNLTF